MKYSEISGLSIKELDKKIISEKEALRKLRFGHAISPIEKSGQIMQTRREIARLQTAKRAQELANSAKEASTANAQATNENKDNGEKS